MATVIPFKAIRPVRDKVHLAASRSYVTYEKSALQAKLRKNPFSYLHVLNPQFGHPNPVSRDTPMGLKKIKERFNDMNEEGVYLKDEAPTYYVYRQEKNGTSFFGLIGCISVEDYFNGTVRKHEATLTKREEKLKNYLRIVDINADPVCFVYPDNDVIHAIISRQTEVRPEYDFSTKDRVRHSLWLIESQEDVDRLKEQFDGIDKVYIADGHHRSASSALLGQERIERNRGHRGLEGYNYFMGIFFAESNIKIHEFNRLVKDLNGLSSSAFLEQISDSFDVVPQEHFSCKPTGHYEMCMYLDGKWYKLFVKPEKLDPEHPSKNLDSSLLTDLILDPVLGIEDLRTDTRVEFIDGTKDLAQMKEKVDAGEMAVAFILYPATIDQLKDIADSGEVMPPKSTWIEPKLMTGLTIYSLEDDHS